MEPFERYSDHRCFFCCAVCNSIEADTFYTCLSCPRNPFSHLCETCYLDDRRGLHRDCDEFDAMFPKSTPPLWLATPTPEIDKSTMSAIPKQFLVRCLARAGSKEAVMGHCFVVGNKLFSALHNLDPVGQEGIREVLLYNLLGGELGAWMTRVVKSVKINPAPKLRSKKEDIVMFEIESGIWDNGVRLVRRENICNSCYYY